MKENFIDWLTALGGQAVTPGGPDDVPLGSARNLPQRDDIWECAVRRARTWITPPDRDPYRPYVVLTASRDGRVRGVELLEEEPTPAEVLNALAKAMANPAARSGGKCRPASVHFDDALLIEAVAPALEKIGVECVFRHTLPEARRALQSFWRSLGEEERIPSLLEVPGVTPFMVEGLFEAAATFYDDAPWRWIGDGAPIEVRYPVGGQPRYAVVMGHGGETYGLAIYDSTEVLVEIYAGTEPDELLGQEIWTALLFGRAIETPFDDLDAIEAYDWPIADPHGYPFPVQLSISGRPKRPGKSDLLRLEAALLAVPRFVREHMQAHEGPPQPSEATLTIMMTDGEDRIHLRYPVPGFEIELEDEWSTIGEDATVRDRNAELLSTFKQWLHNRGLDPKTTWMHNDNVERFAQRFLAEEGGSKAIARAADQATLMDVDAFLGDWILCRADRAFARAVRSHIASLGEFYACLKETGQMPSDSCDEILALLQEDRDYYLELARDFQD